MVKEFHIPNVVNIESVDLIDLITRIQLIDEITKIAGITNIANVDSVDLIDAITNIANIQSVDLIDRITKIDEITKISNVRDLMYSPKTLIVDPSFDNDGIGWGLFGNAEIDATMFHLLGKSLKFPSTSEGEAYQKFPIPIGVDWLTELYFFLRSMTTGTDLVSFFVRYTDQDYSEEHFQVTSAGVWKKQVITSLKAGKYIQNIEFDHDAGEPICWVDDLNTVF